MDTSLGPKDAQFHAVSTSTMKAPFSILDSSLGLKDTKRHTIPTSIIQTPL